MGIISTITGVFGFGIGIAIGLVIGYFLFVYLESADVKVSIFSAQLLVFCIYMVSFFCFSRIFFIVWYERLLAVF